MVKSILLILRIIYFLLFPVLANAQNKNVKYQLTPEEAIILEDGQPQYKEPYGVKINFKNTDQLEVYYQGYKPYRVQLSPDSIFKSLNVTLEKLTLQPYLESKYIDFLKYSSNTKDSYPYVFFPDDNTTIDIIATAFQNTNIPIYTRNSAFLEKKKKPTEIQLATNVSFYKTQKLSTKVFHCQIQWTLFDEKKQEILTEVTTTGRYIMEKKDTTDGFRTAIKYAVDLFLVDADVKKIIEKGTEESLSTELSTEELNIKKIPPSKNPTFSETIKQAARSTVTIKTDFGHGSGFFISADGYFLSNNHVIEGTEKISLILQGGIELPARLERSNADKDVALLKVELGTGFQPFPLKLDTEPGLGEEVIAIGTPQDISLGQTVTKGIISGQREKEGNVYLQTDVSISPGNSGGPLITMSGEVVGIVSAKYIGNGSEGLGFAIPIAEALKALNIVVE